MANEILFEARDDGTAVVTLNRPDALNAIDRAMVRELRKAIRVIDDDPKIDVAIFASTGGKSFCVGVDLKERQQFSDQEAQAFRIGELFPMFRELEEMVKPSVAVVDGHCLGGGFEIALTCDLIVATPQSSFALPETKWGLIPAGGGSRKLPHLIGMARAKEMILTAQKITATTAEQYGLLNRVVGPEIAMQEAGNLAQQIRANVQTAVRASKRSMDQSMNLQRTLAFDLELANLCYGTKDLEKFNARKSV